MPYYTPYPDPAVCKKCQPQHDCNELWGIAELTRRFNTREVLQPPNQHYGECEAVGPNNELGCDILNDTNRVK